MSACQQLEYVSSSVAVMPSRTVEGCISPVSGKMAP